MNYYYCYNAPGRVFRLSAKDERAFRRQMDGYGPYKISEEKARAFLRCADPDESPWDLVDWSPNGAVSISLDSIFGSGTQGR